MSTNVSKQKRKELTDKIKAIHYLHQYITQNNLKGGFVRKDEKSGELCICTGEYSTDITSGNWQLLSEVIL